MDVMTAIRGRHATRAFLDRPVSLQTINELLDLAVRAPSAVNQQPWAFVVVHDQELLGGISQRAKEHWLSGDHSKFSGLAGMLQDSAFQIFYHAPVLVVICATSPDPQAARDCYLAGENFMLAATAKGLATCPVGFAWPALQAADVKLRLRIPEGYDPVLPIALGYEAGEAHATERRAPQVLYCDL